MKTTFQTVTALAGRFFAAVIVGIGVIGSAADPAPNSIELSVSPDDGIVLHSSVTPDAVVTLQTSGNLGDSWQDLGPTFLAPAGVVDLEIPYQPTAGSFFFRFKVESIPVPITETGDRYTLALSREVPFGLLLNAVSRATGQSLFPLDPACADPLRVVPAGTFTGSNAAELLQAVGCGVWAPPLPGDDPQRNNHLVLNTSGQLNPVPGPNGTGRFEEGFAGVTGRPEPVPGGPETRLDPSSPRGFNPGVLPGPDEGGPDEDPTIIPAGHYFRAVIELDSQGAAVLKQVLDTRGDALLIPPPAAVAEGEIVVVCRSPLARSSPGNIYSVTSTPDPFDRRSYSPPPDASEHLPPASVATLKVSVPILPIDSTLEGLMVEVYRVVGPVSGEILDAVTFERNSASFVRLAQISGPQLAASAGPAAREARPQAGGGATLTTVLANGPRSKKFDILVVGDGFNGSEQEKFNDWVQMAMFDGALAQPEGQAIMNSFNIHRLNIVADQSGVTRTDGTNAVNIDSPLGLVYTGVWADCWFNFPTNKSLGDSLTGFLDGTGLAPADIDMVILVANVLGFGGCGGAGSAKSPASLVITVGNGKVGDNGSVLAHELGHAFGALADEYHCAPPGPGLGKLDTQGGGGGEPPPADLCQLYTNAEPSVVNLTTNTLRTLLKWREWIPLARPLPTTSANVADLTQDVGLFSGGTRGQTKYYGGIFRPSYDGRMKSDSKPHNPVTYSAMRERARVWQTADLRRQVRGDFNGDGHLDVVLKDGHQLSLFLAGTRDIGPKDPVTGTHLRTAGGVLNPTWYANDRVYSATGKSFWRFHTHDILIPADFDGDGKTDLICVNLSDWKKRYVCLLKSRNNDFQPVAYYVNELPGWGSLQPGDQFFAADFDGDHKEDLFVYNGVDAGGPALLMLHSSGDALQYTQRYDLLTPSGILGQHEELQVGDFNGDGKVDLLTWNPTDFAQVQLCLYPSLGTQLAPARRYYGSIGANATGGFSYWMREHEQPILLDFNGDKRCDLAIYSGQDWAVKYLTMFASSPEATLQLSRIHLSQVDGWTFSSNDRFRAGDVNGDGLDDLVVFNGANWLSKYLGILKSSDNGQLTGNSLVLGAPFFNLLFATVDDIAVGNFYGEQSWADVAIIGPNTLALLRSQQQTVSLETYYPKWIYNHRFHGLGFW